MKQYSCVYVLHGSGVAGSPFGGSLARLNVVLPGDKPENAGDLARVTVATLNELAADGWQVLNMAFDGEQLVYLLEREGP